MEIAWQASAPPVHEIGECDLYYENKDIEDIYKRWEDLVEPGQLQVIEKILREAIDLMLGKQPKESQSQAQKSDRRRRKRVKSVASPDSGKGRSVMQSYGSLVVPLMHKHHALVRKATLLQAYQMLVSEGTLGRFEPLENILVTKGSKSGSGVLVITVLTSPYPTVDGVKQRFSCEYNCYYCPNEPGQPRSYLRDEPAVLRANQNGFDPVLQFTDRARVLSQNGHPLDKVELLVLGGTWSSYPHSYQEAFVRDLFYAANTVHSRGSLRRERRTLIEEQTENENALCKIIGLTLETRPDCVTPGEIARFRTYGCTRVQLGVQHTDDIILKKINRDCTTQDTKKALCLLKDSCFKVDIHLMPNLPGSTVEIDEHMFDEMLNDPDLQADQWKIYPCEVTPWTVIKKWYDEGTFVPYPESDMLELLMRVKSKVHPWIRLNRVVRDIPTQYIFGGLNNPSLRQYLHVEMANRGLRCQCIRCREIGLEKQPKDIQLVVREYMAQGGTEFFISFEANSGSTILGFARLRICVGTRITETLQSKDLNFEPQTCTQRERRRENTSRTRERSKSPAAAKLKDSEITQSFRKDQFPFPELFGAALVRELHVYGQLIPTTERENRASQHIGLGKQLMAEAERIALANKARKIAVISGVGVRGFYRKLGYELSGEGCMMIKVFPSHRSLRTNIHGRLSFIGILVATVAISVLLFSVTEFEEPYD